MLNLLAYAIIGIQNPVELPYMLIPRARYPFNAMQDTSPSADTDLQKLYLIDDPATSDKISPDIVAGLAHLKVIQIVRKEANGTLVAWKMNGEKLPRADYLMAIELRENFEVGELAVMAEIPAIAATPQTTKDKPSLLTTLGRRTSLLESREANTFACVKIGTPKSKFFNLKLAVRATNFIGSLGKEAGSEWSESDVTFINHGPLPDRGDNQSHVKIEQKGKTLPITYNVYTLPRVDWDAYEKDHGDAGSRSARTSSKHMGNSATHMDVSSEKPHKYWKDLGVYAAIQYQGYFGRIPAEPKS